MKTTTVIKLIAVVVIASGFFGMCRFLEVPPLYISTLAGWGSLCFLFSYELVGSRHRVRNGIEEKTPLQIAWMIAGMGCMLIAAVALFLWS